MERYGEVFFYGEVSVHPFSTHLFSSFFWLRTDARRWVQHEEF